MKILVTGGGGFLGQALCRGLVERGHQVLAFNRSHYPELQALGVGQIRGDLADPQAVLQAVLYWTGGQPFLTQRVLNLVVQEADLRLSPPDLVAQVVTSQLIDNWEAQDVPPHLKTIRDRILRSDERLRGRLLGIYQQVLDAEPPPLSSRKEGGIIADESYEQLQLRLMTEQVALPWDWPVEVNQLEAAAFCRWQAAQTGLPIQLPSEGEWALLRDQLAGDQPDWVEAPGNLNLARFASSCPVDACPQTPKDIEIANGLTIATMNAGAASSFSPFRCRPPGG